MGIDIYAHWDEQTSAEKDAQITGFDTTAGAVGYLREAYHGEPYATRVLVPEAFDAEEEVAIPASVLRERLPAALDAAITRERSLYDPTADAEAPSIRSYAEFVGLIERLESEGRNPRIYASW